MNFKPRQITHFRFDAKSCCEAAFRAAVETVIMDELDAADSFIRFSGKSWKRFDELQTGN